MFAVRGTTQHLDSISVLALVIACALVAFWRPVIKLMITILAIVVLAMLGMGVAVLLQTTHH